MKVLDRLFPNFQAQFNKRTTGQSLNYLVKIEANKIIIKRGVAFFQTMYNLKFPHKTTLFFPPISNQLHLMLGVYCLKLEPGHFCVLGTIKPLISVLVACTKSLCL